MGIPILYVGDLDGTCLQRANALRDLGHDVRHLPSGIPRPFLTRQLYRVSNRLKRPIDAFGTNRRILAEIAATPYPLLWIDRGLSVRPATLTRARRSRPGLKIVSYSPDDMLNPGNQSKYYLAGLAEYDLHVTTKSYNVGELTELGAREVLFIDNAYDPAVHRPIRLSPEERRRYTAGVGFVGSFEPDRAAQMRELARNGIEVSIWGGGWRAFAADDPRLRLRPQELAGLEYSKAINGTKINLGFLRKINRDLQTTRSIEIPACGAFMLAERTDEHARLFIEGKEAEFFASTEELRTKCRYYLEHEEERRRIAEAGLRRCRSDRYDNQGRLRSVLSHLGIGHE